MVLGSASAKKRASAHVVGRPFTNYLVLQPGSAAVDAIAKRLADNGALRKDGLCLVLRNAVLSAHTAGWRNIVEFNNRDPASRAAAGLRALRAASELVYDPSFIPAIRSVASIVATENSIYSDYVHEVVRALDHIPLLKSVLADAVRGLKPVKRKNPGRPC